MTIPNERLPKTAENGFFYRTSKRYGQWTAMAPVRETARRWYCCAVTTREVRSEENGDVERVTEVPGGEFAKGAFGEAWVYVVPKGDYPKTREAVLDWGR